MDFLYETHFFYLENHFQTQVLSVSMMDALRKCFVYAIIFSVSC